MARDYQTKVNVGALPDSITTTRFGSGEFNSIAVELENAVTSSDQTLAPADGTGEVTDQLAMALAIYGAGGAFYHADTGAVNAYVLTPISPKESPPAYFDGFTVIFEAGTVNTTASTVNVNSLGVKDITYSDGNALVGGELAGSCGIKYNLSDDRFELLFSSGALSGLSQVYVIDASQADQGAASANANTYTVFDAAAAIGTSKNATLYFPHNPVAGNQTFFTFDTSLDMTAYPNLIFKMDIGARFDRTTGDEVFTLFSSESLDIGDGQVITTVDMIDFANNGIVRPEWWGGIGDDSTDCTNGWNYAINAISAPGGTVKGLSGSIYQTTANVVLKSNVVLDFCDSTLKMIGASDYYGISCQGSLGTTTDFASNASLGDKTITLTSTANISVDDIILITESSASPIHGYRLIARVVSISSPDVTLDSALPFSVDTANTQTVGTITFKENVGIKNVTIDKTALTASESYGILSTYTANSNFDNISSIGDDNGFSFEWWDQYNCSYKNISSTKGGGGTSSVADIEFLGLTKCNVAGVISTNADSFGPIVYGSSYSNFVNFTISDTNSRGFKAQSCSMCNFSGFSLTNSGATGFGIVQGTSYSNFNNIVVNRTADVAGAGYGYGLWLDAQANNYNVITNVQAYENPDADIVIQAGSDYNKIINATVSDLTSVIDGGSSNNMEGINQYSFFTSDDSAALGPRVRINRYSASPATSDLIGAISLNAQNDAAGNVQYALINGQINSASSGAENGRLQFWTVSGGAQTLQFYVGTGIAVGSPTGGLQGTGTINAEAVYDDGVLLTDYVFDQYLDGKIKKADEQAAQNFDKQSLDLLEYANFWKENRHLMTMPSRSEWEDMSVRPIGKLINRLWETVEIQAIQISQLHDMIKKLMIEDDSNE